MKATTEKAFEAYIEESLLEKGGWIQGTNKEWDKKNALFPERILSFIKDTQEKLYKKMQDLHGNEVDEKIIATLIKERNIKGTLHILRHGFRFFGKTIDMAYFKPAHKLNSEILEQYNKNQLTVTRQVLCHTVNNDTVDLVFSINGLPIATCELKNPATGQNWKNAIAQYRKDRDWRMPLFKFKTSAVVHFAADPDEIHMTTHLRGEKTFFLPFNRGSHPGEVKCGAGNPQHKSGHRTAYFWDEVLQRDSFLEIIGHFMFLETKEETRLDDNGVKQKYTKETLIFPRYHQLDSVKKLITASREERTGYNYLIQHSAGSGKTNSISWLSHRLASLHTETNDKVFDCVVVITDRKVLDRQLQDAIYQIEHAQGVVKAIDQDSKQLAEALVDGTKIVITTLQKFPFVLRGLLHVAGADNLDKPDEESVKQAEDWKEQISKRNYAIIVDEAHSSQTGETARELKEILGTGSDNGSDEGESDWEDRLNQVMESRGTQKNISFFAFTATPKGKTLQLFGRNDEPFHVYSMRQAVQEGFILNVLENYTTYDTFYKLVKSVEEDPELPKKKATKALGKFMSLHPVNIEQRTEIMVEHFRNLVKKRINGKAKAMLVTSSRLHAVKYMLAFERYIEKKKYTDIRPLVAFSGKVLDPDTGIEYTEPNMNTDVVTGKPISESQLPEKFDTPDFQILLVANKYQTGFDQPLLHTMYVDKRLDGVQAVQTLSRLNRISPGKETPFVLDFVNSAEDIYLAFKPYYDQTSLQETTDPQLLETIKHELNAMQVYFWSEVEAFAQVFYKDINKQNPTDHARMQKQVQPAVDRYKALEEDKAKLFRDKISSFVNAYSFLSQIIPYGDSDMEMLYSFSRFLLPHLPRERDYEIIKPEDDVSLQYYRIEKVTSGAIVLEDGEPYGIKGITESGTGKAKDEKKPLSEIIDVLNTKFGTEFSDEDRLFFEQIKEKAVKDDKIIQTAEANTLDKFRLGIKKTIENLMIQRMAENDEIVSRYMEDIDFQKTAYDVLAKDIYDKILSDIAR
ncbi:MAG: restriction endonuclease subunit R [Bacteroidetes bacterium HGW-Bacteroidetes-4]|jgi:type I restriction enzyme R subunit|nr:MAG: restriction endonuclease subunit R [Bacteroidetes bacterium HGW-Bacteroidetes-4]